VDAAAHHVIDLLEDPSAEALVGWLGVHPGAEVICRDRDEVYASAARRGAPGALQVADRWHVVHNLAEALERWTGRVLAALRGELTSEEAATPRADSAAAPLPPVSPGRLVVRTE
jgi:transposase